MSIQMLNSKIAVEQLKKSTKNKNKPMWDMPEVSDNLGIVRFMPEGIVFIKPGDKVYYGGQREQIRMAGLDVHIMELDNVIAIVEDDSEEAEAENT